MDNSYLKLTSAKRFVIEDSITKVTSDGEPHEMMTMIAGLSGVLAAMVILTVLIFFVGCKKAPTKHECDRCSETGSCTGGSGKKSPILSVEFTDSRSKCSSIATIYDGNGHGSIRNIRRSTSASTIRAGGNLQQNLNKAFEGSELNLQDSLERPKKQKRTHWQDELQTQRETTIDIERY
ncbi:uncharacterized protein LOC106090816 [Stomoxys calcitrans]|uniref:uncharacterized protein LOC106090816 n=1 Tax=Stomoxys calcitrans TaxID=35570 RepID=UPI0027E3069C|nr:uncharacterized protein LOC106090816 [Stomoxys calcitrans]XP_059224365.1 uncharacterized protein LOC106090816 [Stomoxys calcitrans]